MERYVGMDVSLKETSICVVDDDGEIVTEGTVISEPAAIADVHQDESSRGKAHWSGDRSDDDLAVA